MAFYTAPVTKFWSNLVCQWNFIVFFKKAFLGHPSRGFWNYLKKKSQFIFLFSADVLFTAWTFYMGMFKQTWWDTRSQHIFTACLLYCLFIWRNTTGEINIYFYILISGFKIKSLFLFRFCTLIKKLFC